MGQYYKVINIDKKEVLNPRAFGNGNKLLEFTPNPIGIMMGLGLLTTNGNGRGVEEISMKIRAI